MNLKSKCVICWSLVLLITALCACQQAPDQDAVVSKNDGSFDVNAVVSADAHNASDATQPAVYTETFQSTDGSVEFHLNVETMLTAADMPVLEVAPHYITEDEAKHVAHVLFGDAEHYDREPFWAFNFSKSEIQEYINRWSSYANEDTIVALTGNESQADDVTVVKKFIAEFTDLYEQAPDKNPHTLCQWIFRKDAYYDTLPDEITEKLLRESCDAIETMLLVEGIPYFYSASTRNEKDFKLNLFWAGVYGVYSPCSLDERYYLAQLCRTAEPTDDQIAAAKEQASQMLVDMDLGCWKIDECYVETIYYGDVPEYTINVNALPVLNGVPALWQTQPLMRSEEVYSSSYYVSNAEFRFNADGKLVHFAMYSPIDTTIINENAVVIPIADLIERAKNHLILSDCDAYGPAGLAEFMQEDIDCTVSINRIDYNLARINAPNSDDRFYYVPSITFIGEIEYTSHASGDLVFSEKNRTLLTLNAIDGTVIESIAQ